MGEHGKTHKTSILERTTDNRSGLSVLLAAASLLGVSVGYAGATPSEPVSLTPSDSSGANAAAANPAKPDMRLAEQLPKVSTPQVHVNTGTHVNTTTVHTPSNFGSNSIKLNSSALKIKSPNSLYVKGATSNSHKVENANSSFLKLDGIKGESQDDKHKDEIHIESFSR